MDADGLKLVPRGYLSEESKRRFTLTTGILGAAFFFGQMFIPFVLMILFMPAFFFGGGMDLSIADVEGAAAWKGQLWYPVRKMEHPARQKSGVTLWSLAAGADAKPVDRGTFVADSVWLLSAPDRLWVLSERQVRSFTDAGLSEPLETEPVSPISRPFLYKGAPALIQRTPEAVVLLRLGKDGWTQDRKLQLGKEEASAADWDVRVLSTGETVHVFRRIDAAIYYRAGFGESEWTSVCSSGSVWSAVLMGDVPAVFSAGRAQGFAETVTGTRLGARGWEPFFRHDLHVMGRLGVVSAGPDRFSVLLQGFPGNLRICEAVDGKMSGQRKVGRGFPFPGFFVGFFILMQAGTLVAPLLLAMILSALMARHRVSDYGIGAQKAPLASLTRRALAQIIDMAIDTAPMMAAGLMMFADFEDSMMSPLGMLKNFGIMGLGFLWLAFTFFLFSWTEGRSGWTPGKGLLGIRVLGIDLQPCGFGRALVRNLLKFADGFMNFMVGILVSALSENWQRVGDMAARTVVVRVLPGHRPPLS